MKHITIAIDGPAGAGKTTVAKLLAERLNILYLNTGALYRALGLKCKAMNLNPMNEVDAKKVIEHTDLNVRYQKGEQRVILDQKDVTESLHTEDISSYASKISAHKVIREFLISLQQKIAEEQSVVMDGRDIGTVVLPNASYKFYLDASVEERARRRYQESKNADPSLTFQQVLDDIKTRDYADMHRAVSPLKKADDAVVVDSTHLNVEGVMQAFISRIKE